MPVALVVTSVARVVASSRRLSLTPGIPAPDGSRTSPLVVPVSTCADTVMQTAINTMTCRQRISLHSGFASPFLIKFREYKGLGNRRLERILTPLHAWLTVCAG